MGLWWLVPIAIGAGAAIAQSLRDKAGAERRRFQEEKEKTAKLLEKRSRALDRRLFEAQETLDFRTMMAEYRAAVQEADLAYRLVQDARSSARAVEKAVERTLEQEHRLHGTRPPRPAERRARLGREISGLQQTRGILTKDLASLREDSGRLLKKVRTLNRKTRELKVAIRDGCGTGGRVWFERLEARNANRRRRQPSTGV